MNKKEPMAKIKTVAKKAVSKKAVAKKVAKKKTVDLPLDLTSVPPSIFYAEKNRRIALQHKITELSNEVLDEQLARLSREQDERTKRIGEIL